MYTNIPDQGITFDKDSYLIDRHSQSNHDFHHKDKGLRMSSHPAQSHAGNGGNPGGDGGDSNGDSSYDEESKDKENESLPPTDEEEEFNKDISIHHTLTRSRDYTSPRCRMGLPEYIGTWNPKPGPTPTSGTTQTSLIPIETKEQGDLQNI